MLVCSPSLFLQFQSQKCFPVFTSNRNAHIYHRMYKSMYSNIKDWKCPVNQDTSVNQSYPVEANTTGIFIMSLLKGIQGLVLSVETESLFVWICVPLKTDTPEYRLPAAICILCRHILLCLNLPYPALYPVSVMCHRKEARPLNRWTLCVSSYRIF